eukprot:PhM_4_TR16796/c2_g1_i5/m.97662/K18261/DYSF; dysferlin
MCRGGPVAVRRRRSGLTTSSVKRTYLNRSCVWNERLEIRAPWELDNSEGMSCIPDIIVTLMDGNDYVAYKRVPASDVMGSTGSSEQTLFLVPFAEPDDARDKDTGLIGCRMRITHTAPKSLQHRMPADTQSHKNQKPVTASPITVKGAEALTLRAHIYKARNLPAGDDNGLSDPYVRVVFGGGCGQTNFLTNKVNPSFNECVEFDVDAFSPYPPLVVEAWDHDTVGRDTFLGRCVMPLSRTSAPQPLQWLRLNDVTSSKRGEILCSFELVPRGTVTDPAVPLTERVRVEPPPFVSPTYMARPIAPSITPEVQTSTIEIDCVGLRDMDTYQMIDVKDAILEFIVDDVSVMSKRVKGVNPDFLQKVTLVVDLPVDPAYIPDLTIKVYDHRFFGQRVLIGSCSVGLAALMQSTRGIDFYDEESEEDEEHLDHAEDFDSEIDNKDRSLKASMSPRSGSSVNNYGSTEMSGPVLEPDDDDDNISPWLRAYFKGKIPRYPTNLERQYLGFKDRFLDYPLTRGTSSNTVGYFKGRIHVATATNEPVPPVAATTPLESARVIVNVYVLRASSLIPHDTALTGGSNDPYLKVSVGKCVSAKGKVKEEKDLRKNGLHGTLHPEFMQSVQFIVDVPTVNEAKVSVWDADNIGRDELIGFTVVNLEDRWWSYKRGGIPAAEHTERRSLYHPEQSGATAQGRVEMWIDIKPYVDRVERPIDIQLPPNERFELRVIVWNVSDCIPQETAITGEEMTDIYVKCFMEGKPDDSKETDVHYRSLDGKGAFNWRMKFPLIYVRRDRKVLLSGEEKVTFSLFSTRQQHRPVSPTLVVQIWDNDLMPMTDDFMGEMKIPLDQRLPLNQSAQDRKRIPLNLFGKTPDPTNPETKIVRGLQQTPKLWYDVTGKDKKPVGKVQLSFQLVPLAKTGEKGFEAGDGRSEPNANPFLPEPERPGSSFFWLTSPLKTLYYVIWRNWGKYMVAILCIALWVVLLYGFVNYSLQVFAHRVWGTDAPAPQIITPAATPSA